MQNSTRLNDGTFVVNARQIQIPNNSVRYIEASKELSKACLLSQESKDRVKDLNLEQGKTDKVIQILKDALNSSYNLGCIEALGRYIN